MKLAALSLVHALPAALALSACSGHVSFFAGYPTFDEREPNDTVHGAPFFGGVEPGTRFAISGHIDDDQPDLYDGFALRADEPCTIEFALESHELFTDLDVCVYDPELDEYVVCCDGPSDPEKGSVTILEPGKVVHLVVSSARGDTRYTLHVSGQLAYGAATASSAEVLAPAAGDDAKAARRRGYAHPDDEPVEHDDTAPRVRPFDLLWIDVDRGEVVRGRGVRAGHEWSVERPRIAEARPAP